MIHDYLDKLVFLQYTYIVLDKDKYEESYCADVDTIGMGRYSTVKCES
ncbi:MAG: hypothetical protein OIN83_00800 [Candidatus Methanoperedens sp.]|nr:hypothetical protein [Candidatus Methanoperedens sp.]